MRLLAPLLIVLSMSLLTACEPADPAKAMMADYQQRLGNVLDAEPSPLSLPALPSLPRKRELIQPIADLRLGLLDAYELRQCGLFNLIAERNSSLGKVADRFRQLDYELSFIRVAKQCLPQVKDDSIQTALNDAIVSKTQQLPAVIWNTLIDSSAWQAQWSLPIHTLPVELPAHSNAVSAMTQFGRLVQQPSSTHESILEWQESIEKQPILGALFVSLTAHTDWLNQTSQLIADNQSKVLCGENFDTTRLERLKTVFYKYYVGEVQPYLARVDGLYRDVSPTLNQLASLETPPPFSAYKSAYWQGEAYTAYKQAIRHHADVWQQLFQRCNVTLGE
ncbi:DUF3080 domain-containing protein [Salinivibrio sp. PR919]|uniref:DUF3080 domain-containing protein n=1 Tax=Salinivibrio sp. PR919 TaxID=1909491 RepID=UPI0009871144|nr:DUF3080 domain-containing protein [Salinivibrio sp. PR919]OOF12704.1 hypothetical protein BZG83_11045 [Salinivibrio sp. PR919]